MAPRRILILTADIGAGHDLPAQLLAEGIAARAPGTEVTIADGIRAMGRVVQGVGRSGSEFVLRRMPWLFDLEYWLIARFRPTRRLGSELLYRIGRPGLGRLIEAADPDVIVSTYPGRPRRSGGCGSRGGSAAVRHGDHRPRGARVLGASRHRPAPDHPRGVARGGAGDRGRRHGDPPRPRALAPGVRGAAGAWRRARGARAAGRRAGGRGVGRRMGGGRPGARGPHRARDPGATAVCLCGINEGLRARMRAAFGREPRVRVEGFTDRMAEWLRPPTCSCTRRPG